MTRTLACVSVLLMMAAPTAAQAVCKDSETVTACLLRLEGATETTRAAAAKAQADVRKTTETGLQDINGLSSSVKDFLPLLQLSGLAGGVRTDDTTGAVSVTFNTRLLTRDPSLQLKAVIETRPRLFDELRKQLPATNRDALEQALLGSKTGAEHTTLHASYNVTSDRFGRNFSRHMTLYNLLFQEAVAGAVNARVRAEGALTRRLLAALGPDISLDDTLWADIPEAARAAAAPIITALAQGHLALQAAFAEAVTRTGLDRFGQLVNNQPQVSFSVSSSFLDDLHGPNLVSGRIAVEKGLFANLNGVFGAIDPQTCRANAADCLTRYASYATRPETTANVHAASRVAAYAEVIRHADYRYTNAEAGLNVAFPRGTTIAAGVDAGTLFGVTDAGAAGGRVDASLRFERRSQAPDEMRLVASLVVTRKVGDIAIPFGIVYANKPRFLSGVDKGLTANVGLKFNVFPGPK